MRHLGGVLLTATSLFISSVVGAADPIVIKGAKFFYQNSGAQFFLQGIAYQQDYTGVGAVPGADSGGGFNDPLANPAGCKRDIPYLKELKINTVRVYAVDATANHDECMSMLADAGIYVVADLSAPDNGQSIISSDPEWNVGLFSRYISVVDALSKYTNTLGYFAGNEVAYAPNSTNAAPFVKAAVRDTKAYIKQKGYRTIGVGYAADDNPNIRVPIANYVNCGDQTDAVDFYGYNVYSWCGDSSYQSSGYENRTNEFKSYSVPAFFAEYGCNTPPRLFTDVLALYGSQMSPVWSGGIVYEYFQATNNYGVVTIGSNSKVTTLTDFKTLSTQMAKIKPSSVSMNAYTPSNQPQACPTSNINFEAQATPLPPAPNAELCSCMYDILSCVPDPSTSTSDYKKLFGYICGKDKNACAGFAADAGTGTYGAYSMCNSTQQLGWAMNLYYYGQNKASTACSFGGAAKLKSPSANSACKSLLSQAGAGGTGTVTNLPSGTAGAGSASGSSVASALTVRKPEGGLLMMTSVLALAMITGFAAVLL